MSFIKVELPHNIFDGAEVSFKVPENGSFADGLRVYYSDDNGERHFSNFVFADAHGQSIYDTNKLFATDAVVKVILDTNTHRAFVQNASTNSYLEAQFNDIRTKALNDYVLKTGTSFASFDTGNGKVFWQYRQWSSGQVEFWGNAEIWIGLGEITSDCIIIPFTPTGLNGGSDDTTPVANVCVTITPLADSTGSVPVVSIVDPSYVEGSSDEGFGIIVKKDSNYSSKYLNLYIYAIIS